jgi:polyferredoxin
VVHLLENPPQRREPVAAAARHAVPAATWVRPPTRGRLHKARRALQGLTSLLFIAAPFLDLFRFDLKNGALILAGVPLGLGELGAVYALIVLAFVIVFAGALIYGRLYCGWICPQTTLSEIVATMDRWASPKLGRDAAKARILGIAATLAMSAFVSASLASYFVDPADRLSPSRLAWIGWGATFAVMAVNLLWIRHRFCATVCPYGIIQNISQDAHTLGVSLDPNRRSECTNCMMCVRACFMGIDVRDQAFDSRCLNCGDCVAASASAKGCPPVPLIHFRYGNQESRWPAPLRKLGIVDGRRAGVFALVIGAAILALLQTAGRQDLDVQIAAQFERTRVDSAGVVHDFYQLSTSNRLDRPVDLRLEVRGIPGLALESPQEGFTLGARARDRREMVLSAPAASADRGALPIVVRCLSEGGVAVEVPVRFFVPSGR